MPRDLYGLGDYNTNQIQVFMKIVQLEGANYLPILYVRPDAAPDPVVVIQKIPLEEVPYIIPDTFAGKAGPKIAAAFTIPQLAEIGAQGEEYLREAIKLNLKLAASEKPHDAGIKALNEYVNNSPAWQL